MSGIAQGYQYMIITRDSKSFKYKHLRDIIDLRPKEEINESY